MTLEGPNWIFFKHPLNLPMFWKKQMQTQRDIALGDTLSVSNFNLRPSMLKKFVHPKQFTGFPLERHISIKVN